MNASLASLTGLASIAMIASAAHAKTLDIVFVPDDATAPPLVVVIDDATAATPTSKSHRALSWAIPGHASGIFSDDSGKAPILSQLPSVPKGAQLSDKSGAVSLILEDAGDWQIPYAKVQPPKNTPALPLPTATSLRLVVDPSADPLVSPAVLYGSTARVSGRAVLRSDQPPLRAVVVAGKDLIEGAAAPVDLVASCGRDVPSSVTLAGATPTVSFKLGAASPPACAGDYAVVPVNGSKLETGKKDVPAWGLVLVRAPAL